MTTDRRPLTLTEKLVCIGLLAALFTFIVACANAPNIKNSNAKFNKNGSVSARVTSQGTLRPSLQFPGQRKLEFDAAVSALARGAPLGPPPGSFVMAVVAPLNSQVGATVADPQGNPYVFGMNVANLQPNPAPNPQLLQYLNNYRMPPPGFQWYVFQQPITYQGLPDPISIETTFHLKYNCDPYLFSGPENVIYAYAGNDHPAQWVPAGGTIVTFAVPFSLLPPIPAMSTWGALIALLLLVLLGGWAVVRRTRGAPAAG